MRLFLAALILSMSAAMAAPAGAQPVDVVGPHNPYCGAWENGAWVPNGNCVEETAPQTSSTTVITTGPAAMHPPSGRTYEHINGTITGVQGHLVTITTSNRTLVINDSPALAADATGRVAVGRQVTAHGYWDGDTFYATRLQ